MRAYLCACARDNRYICMYARAEMFFARAYVCTCARGNRYICRYARANVWNLLSALDSVVKNAKIFRFCCLLWILLSKTTYGILNKLKCLDSVIFDSVKKYVIQHVKPRSRKVRTKIQWRKHAAIDPLLTALMVIKATRYRLFWLPNMSMDVPMQFYYMNRSDRHLTVP